MDIRQHGPLFLSVALIAIVGELVWRLRSRRGYDGRAALTTLGIVAGNLAAGAPRALLLGGVYGAVWAMVPHRFTVEQWHSWVIGFFAVEVAYYWFHRLSHEIRWLWASHSVHHSAEQLTFLASLRLGWTNLLSLGWVVYLPLIVIGFDPRLVVALLALNLNYQFFLHSEWIPRLGPLERVLNTPHHHRAHHARNPEFLDRNYGGMLIVWDRLFGTIAPESETPKRYGLAGKGREDNPVKLAFREWAAMLQDFAAAQGWRAKARALIEVR
ncbi:MAG: sterol desaturase family protein [Porphyrobacter sp.]|nr:sterol desaturase family protein [Porphyrobacter sp.]